MRTATLIHQETGVEFYKDGELFTPTHSQKAIWVLYGTPENIKRIERTFETEIDEIIAFSKREVEAKVEQNFKDGKYNFLPPMGFNHNIITRY
jgi:hypothetical protein